MAKKQLLEILQNSGLTQNESGVYLTALSLGPTSALEISRKSDIKRSTVYDVISVLKQKGLMSVRVTGFKKEFVAEDPKKLEVLVDQRRVELKKSIPELSALYNLNENEGTLKYYEGLEAIKGVFKDLIQDMKPKDTYYAVSNSDHFFAMDPKYFYGWIERRAKLNVDTRLMLEDTPAARDLHKYQKNYNVHVKILPKEISIKGNIITTPQKMVVLQAAVPISAVVIENKNTIAIQQQVFDVLWNSLNE